jgi:ribose transport system substrate-binding protein
MATCVDMHHDERATQLVADAIRAHPNVGCVVALYSYSAPSVLKALEQTGQLGKVKIVGFDLLPDTLAGVEAGHIAATMQQAQYDIGYDSIRALADSLNGDCAAAGGASPLRYLGVSAITKQNIAQTRQEMSQRAASAAANSGS